LNSDPDNLKFVNKKGGEFKEWGQDLKKDLKQGAKEIKKDLKE